MKGKCEMKTIVLVNFAMALSCAAAEVSSNQVAQIREVLWVFSGAHHANMLPPPYARLQRMSAEQDFPMSAVNAEIIAAAEESNARLKQGLPRWEQDAWPHRCSTILSVMGSSKDRVFLPCIEKIGTESFDSGVRTTAVQAHIAICGFDSFPFVERAIEALPEDGHGEDAKYYIYKAFLIDNARKLDSTGQGEKICDSICEKIFSEKNGLTAGLMDDFLSKNLSGYSTSRQRYSLAKKFHAHINGYVKEHFTPIEEKFDKIPEAQRTDLSQRFKQLPALKEVKAE
jgi:hypothetical protein